MNCKSIIATAAFAFSVWSAFSPARAATLYDSGPTTGNLDALGIYAGSFISDSFTLSQASTITSVDFVSWSQFPISGLSWSITTGLPQGATGPGAGTGATVSQLSTLYASNIRGYLVDNNTFSTGSVSLSAGTYYLTLTNAVTGNSNANWDEHTAATSTIYINGTSALSGESNTFQIIGTANAVSAVPLPSTWGMMLMGLVGLGFIAYRQNKLSKPALLAA
jgi:PEP-CTERM motif